MATAALGETFVQLAFLAIGFCLYLTRQGVAICATTILQEEVDDAYRGRVFAFYDMMFNVTYVDRRRDQRGLHAGHRPVTGDHRRWWPPDTRSSPAGYWLLSRHRCRGPAIPARLGPGRAEPFGRGPAQQLLSGPLAAERAVLRCRSSSR